MPVIIEVIGCHRTLAGLPDRSRVPRCCFEQGLGLVVYTNSEENDAGIDCVMLIDRLLGVAAFEWLSFSRRTTESRSSGVEVVGDGDFVPPGELIRRCRAMRGGIATHGMATSSSATPTTSRT